MILAPCGMFFSRSPKSLKSGHEVMMTIPKSGSTFLNRWSNPTASSPENCRSIMTISGWSERKRFSATKIFEASPTILVLCNRRDADIVASSNASSLMSKTRAGFARVLTMDKGSSLATIYTRRDIPRVNLCFEFITQSTDCLNKEWISRI